jgi:hypothetical protein
VLDLRRDVAVAGDDAAWLLGQARGLAELGGDLRDLLRIAAVDISPNLPPSSSCTEAAPTGSGSEG